MIHLLPLFISLLLFSCEKEKAASGPQISGFNPQKGSYNNTVIITGTHFDSLLNATSVYFNDVPGTVVGVTDTSISVSVPLNATTGKLRVSVPSGTAISSDDFMVLPGKWRRKADFPGKGRSIAIGFTIGSKGYLLGGADPGMTLNDFWSYDMESDTWTSLPGPGFYLEDGVAVVINGKAYVGVGVDRAIIQGGTTAWWQFDPSTGTWMKKKDFPGVARSGAIGFEVDGKAYVGLGWERKQSNTYLYDWYSYDPLADGWVKKADNTSTLNYTMYMTGGFVSGNIIYVGLGAFGQKNWWTYSPADNSWVKQTDFPGSVTFAPKGFLLNGKGYIAGGGSECWSFDTNNKTWTQVAFPTDLNAGVVFTFNNKAYYVTGKMGKAVWAFEP